MFCARAGDAGHRHLSRRSAVAADVGNDASMTDMLHEDDAVGALVTLAARYSALLPATLFDDCFTLSLISARLSCRCSPCKRKPLLFPRRSFVAGQSINRSHEFVAIVIHRQKQCCTVKN